MRSLNKILFNIALFVLLPMAAQAVSAQDARINFDRLNGLETRARDVVEVNVDGKLLDLAKRVTVKVNDSEAKRIGQAISGLQGIYVRVYRFENENEYNMSDVDEIRSQLAAPGWDKVANVRSKKNDQKVDVFTKFTGDLMSGVAVVITEAKSIAVVNMIGPIDIEMLVEISGKMNIPKIDIERDTNGSVKNKNDKE